MDIATIIRVALLEQYRLIESQNNDYCIYWHFCSLFSGRRALNERLYGRNYVICWLL